MVIYVEDLRSFNHLGETKEGKDSLELIKTLGIILRIHLKEIVNFPAYQKDWPLFKCKHSNYTINVSSLSCARQMKKQSKSSISDT